MPYIKKKADRLAYNPKPVRKPGKNQRFYNSTRWRKARASYLQGFGLLDEKGHAFCEVCHSAGRRVVSVVVDHIIRIIDGGAKLDKRNFCAMCESCHNRKSGMEGHRSILVDHKQAETGLIPVDKNDIIILLNR